jgi:hypothetical protein
MFCRRETDNLTREFYEKAEGMMEFDSHAEAIVEETIAAAADEVLTDHL